MSTETQTFPCTPAQYAAMQALAAQNGLTITGDSGVASKLGVTIAYSYDDPNLTLTLVRREFFDPSADEIEANLAAMVAKVTAS